MKRTSIPAAPSITRWQQDPAYRAAYDALDEEFALAAALISARRAAEMTQEQVAAEMGTTQAVIARMESGRTMPSTRSLTRFANATHSRLRITFEAQPKPRERSTPKRSATR